MSSPDTPDGYDFDKRLDGINASLASLTESILESHSSVKEELHAAIREMESSET